MRKISKLIVAVYVVTMAISPVLGAGVIEKIPAGTMGYIAVNNINSTCNRMEVFLDKIGIGSMLRFSGANGETQPEHYLANLLIQGAAMGSGFDINGGFAIVALDPAELGIDLAAEFEKESPELSNMPFSIFLPSGDIDTLFADREITLDEATGFKKVSKGADSLFAIQGSGYVMLSSNSKVLEKLQTAFEKSAAEELNAEEKAIADRGGLIIHMNIPKARPVFTALMKKAQQQAQTQPASAGMMKAFMPIYMAMYEKMFEQFASVTETLTLAPEGLVLEEVTTAAPQSDMGKILLAQKNVTVDPATLLNCVPSTPYALAVGTGGIINDELVIENSAKMLRDLLADTPIESTTKEQLIDMAKEFYSQFTSMQMVIGGPVEDKGVFGAAFVFKCKDSAKLREIAATKADIINSLLGEKDSQMKCVYTKDSEKIGEINLDSFEFQSAVLTDDPEKMQKVTAAFGEDKIRFLIATPDSTTMVMTIGGAAAYMNTALEAAKGSSAFENDLKAAMAINAMPKNPNLVGMLNVSNTLDLLLDGMEKVSPGSTENFPAIMMSCKKPVVFATQNKGISIHSTAVVPAEIFQYLFQIGMMFMMQNGGSMGGSPFGGF